LHDRADVTVGYKKGKKNMYSFEIKCEMCKTSILWLGIVYLM